MVKVAVLLLLTVCLLVNIGPVSAAVITQAQPREIDEMQSLQLQVRVTGTDDVEGLDLTPLNADFEVQATSTQSQLRVVNGEITSWVDLVITLRPKRTGQLTIPPLSLGNERSDPISINVRAVASSLQNQIDQLVWFEITVDRSEVFVQAQVRYTRRLYYTSGVQIYGDLPGAPVIADAVVLPLGETTQDITMKNETRYGVLEQRYAIFPERSGSFTIPGFSVQSSVRLNDVRRGVQVKAADKTINVLPIPSAWPVEKPWFPAADLSIRETWAPDASTVNAGTSLRRTIEIVAIGNTGSSIPPPDTSLTSPLIRRYPEAPVLEDDTRGESVKGKRLQNDGFVPAWGGTVEIPGVDISWWDTEERRVRLTRLPPRQLNIAGEQPPVTSADVTPGEQANDQLATIEADAVAATPARWWPALAAALLALAAILVGKLFPHQGNLGLSWPAAARRAIRNKDLHGLREAMIEGAMQHHATGRSTALERLADEPEWRRLQAADQQRFAESSGIVDLEQAMQETLGLVRRLLKNRVAKKSDILPPLYARDGR